MGRGECLHGLLVVEWLSEGEVVTVPARQSIMVIMWRGLVNMKEGPCTVASVQAIYGGCHKYCFIYALPQG